MILMYHALSIHRLAIQINRIAMVMFAMFLIIIIHHRAFIFGVSNFLVVIRFIYTPAMLKVNALSLIYLKDATERMNGFIQLQAAADKISYTSTKDSLL